MRIFYSTLPRFNFEKIYDHDEEKQNAKIRARLPARRRPALGVRGEPGRSGGNPPLRRAPDKIGQALHIGRLPAPGVLEQRGRMRNRRCRAVGRKALGCDLRAALRIRVVRQTLRNNPGPREENPPRKPRRYARQQDDPRRNRPALHRLLRDRLKRQCSRHTARQDARKIDGQRPPHRGSRGQNLLRHHGGGPLRGRRKNPRSKGNHTRRQPQRAPGKWRRGRKTSAKVQTARIPRQGLLLGLRKGVLLQQRRAPPAR